MYTIRVPALAGIALLLAMFSTTSQAYGPRDRMSYQHPTVMLTKAECNQRSTHTNTHHPRQARKLALCAVANESRRHEQRIHHNGPRPRAARVKTSRQLARR